MGASQQLADAIAERLRAVSDDQADFTDFLAEIGWTDAQIHADMAAAKYVSAEQHPPEVTLAPSPIHGTGCFCDKAYRSGDRVCIVRYQGNKTIEGRFINHSPAANVKFVVIGDETHAFALRNLEYGEEILVDYRQSFGVAKALNNAPTQSVEVVDTESMARSMSASMAIDKLEAWLTVLPQQPEVLNHDFTEGIYARQSVIEAGNLFTTETHKIDHPFALTEGEAYVWTKKSGWGLFKAPLLGVTRAGTRRVVLTKTRCVMTTFHPNPDNDTNLSRVWDRLYVKRQPPADLSPDDVNHIHQFMQSVESAFKGQTPLPDLIENDAKQSTRITS